MSDGYNFDFNRITYREVLEMNLDDDDDSDGVDDDTLDLIARTLTSWPHGDEISAESIKDLGLGDFAALSGAFRDAMDGVFKSGS